MGSYGAGTGGNISTCVEQTCPVSSPGCPRRKHLHMRGADMVLSDVHCSQIETSPHAWSRHVSYDTQAINARNISTCVEQTRPPTRVRAPAWKHLHMRGADLSGMVWLQSESETSPHAWSRLSSFSGQPHTIRNISTCVEQTRRRLSVAKLQRKHLHMRGADVPKEEDISKVEETSPHAWSRPCWGR